MTDHSSPAPASTPARAQSVLVLQGGGALGSYQAGAYQALCHFDFEPEWIAGISIGAISAAIIATFGVPGFFTPRFPPAPLWPSGTTSALSYYETAPLKKTLERLVDF